MVEHPIACIDPWLNTLLLEDPIDTYNYVEEVVEHDACTYIIVVVCT